MANGSGFGEGGQAAFDAYDAHRMFDVDARAPKARPELFRTTTFDEFLALIETTDETERFEWVGGQIVQQQATQTRRHAKLEKRIESLLDRQLDRARWQALREYSVFTGGTYRITDVLVDPADAPDMERFSSAPAMIVEVTSPSSIRRDMKEKPVSYRDLATLHAYVVVHHDRRTCDALIRDEVGTWPDEMVVFTAGDTISVPALDVTLSVDDIYRGILDVGADADDRA